MTIFHNKVDLIMFYSGRFVFSETASGGQEPLSLILIHKDKTKRRKTLHVTSEFKSMAVEIKTDSNGSN